MRFLRRGWPAALALAVLVLVAARSHAQEAASEPDTADGPKTVIKYASCAGGLAFATNVATGLAAFMVCVRMFLDEFN